jgi:hypothetical protein
MSPGRSTSARQHNRQTSGTTAKAVSSRPGRSRRGPESARHVRCDLERSMKGRKQVGHGGIRPFPNTNKDTSCRPSSGRAADPQRSEESGPECPGLAGDSRRAHRPPPFSRRHTLTLFSLHGPCRLGRSLLPVGNTSSSKNFFQVAEPESTNRGFCSRSGRLQTRGVSIPIPEPTVFRRMSAVELQGVHHVPTCADHRRRGPGTQGRLPFQATGT